MIKHVKDNKNNTFFIVNKLLEQNKNALYDEENDIIYVNDKKYKYRRNVPNYVEIENGKESTNILNEKNFIKKLNISISPEEKANSGRNILELNDILKLKVNMTLEECSLYKTLQSISGKGLLDKKYNIYPHLFENIKFDDIYLSFLERNFYSEMMNNKNFIKNKENIIINNVEDFIKITIDYFNFIKNDNEYLVKIIDKVRYAQNDSYEILRKNFPNMNWIDEWMNQNPYPNEDIIYSKFYKNNKEIINNLVKNPGFRAYLLSDISYIGDFYGCDNDLIYFILNKHYNEFLNLLDSNQIKNICISELNNLDKSFLIQKINLLSKDLKLNNDILNYLCDYIKKNKNNNLSKNKFISFNIKDILNGILEFFNNNYEDVYNYDYDLFIEIVKIQDFKNIKKDIAILMPKDYKKEWEIQNGILLDNDTNLSTMFFEDSIYFKIIDIFEKRN